MAGEAKQRGTFEQRKATSKEHREALAMSYINRMRECAKTVNRARVRMFEAIASWHVKSIMRGHGK